MNQVLLLASVNCITLCKCNKRHKSEVRLTDVQMLCLFDSSPSAALFISFLLPIFTSVLLVFFLLAISSVSLCEGILNASKLCCRTELHSGSLFRLFFCYKLKSLKIFMDAFRCRKSQQDFK